MNFELGKDQQVFFFNVRVDENQNRVSSFRRFAQQHINRCGGRTQTREFCAIEKTRVMRDELVQLREFRNDIITAVPVQTGGAVDANFFGSEPFHTTSETEAAARTGKGAEPVS